jgi:hypothetical protein
MSSIAVVFNIDVRKKSRATYSSRQQLVVRLHANWRDKGEATHSHDTKISC